MTEVHLHLKCFQQSLIKLSTAKILEEVMSDWDSRALSIYDWSTEFHHAIDHRIGSPRSYRWIKFKRKRISEQARSLTTQQVLLDGCYPCGFVYSKGCHPLILEDAERTLPPCTSMLSRFFLMHSRPMTS